MKKLSFLLGALTLLLVQYATSAYYTYKFDAAFVESCGVTKGYSGVMPERLQCVYDELGYIDDVAAVILTRPKYDLFSGWYLEY